MRMLTGSEFQTLGAENRKARDPKDWLWQGTESWWEWDERRDLIGLCCCRRSERYGGRLVCKALKVKVASLNCIRHSIGSRWRLGVVCLMCQCCRYAGEYKVGQCKEVTAEGQGVSGLLFFCCSVVTF